MRSRGTNGAVRYECDDCQRRESVPEGEAPRGWTVRLVLDVCGPCVEARRARAAAVQ